MNQESITSSIEQLFRKKVRSDTKVRNASLLVHSKKSGINLAIAEGSKDTSVHPHQPNYMASVGKLFTSVLIARFVEKGTLRFIDPISEYLDQELVDGLHVYKNKEYTTQITVRHLLNQTSGLDDNFIPLLNTLIRNKEMDMTPKEAVTWAKQHLTPLFPPGRGFRYADTNYQLLGLIIENITKKPFHEVLHSHIFKPLEMNHSFMLHRSKPMKKPLAPTADFFINNVRLNDIKGYAGIDYSAGGIVAPTNDLLRFMKALVNHQLVSKDTLETMKNDNARFGSGIDYGYGIWQFTAVPLLVPKKFNSWGVAGITGAFLFYHPDLEAYLIGCFNNSSYMKKALRFALFKIVNKLWKAN